MKTVTFKIVGMDCAEEITALKRELGPLVGGEQYLAFDLLNARLTIQWPGPALPDEQVIRIVAQTGMQATPWDEHRADIPQRDGYWRKYGRLMGTAFSGICIVLAFVIHAAQHGLVDAFSGEGVEGHRFPLLAIALYGAAVVCGGWFVFPRAVFALRRLRPDMNLLMTVAIFGAVGIGEWFEAATVSFLFGVALLLESWSVSRARRAIAALVNVVPPNARCVDPTTGSIEERPVQTVSVDSVVQVRPGERIPLDGIITKGSTSINQAPITGESVPVPKDVGSEVFAGSINESGAFEFRVTKPPTDTTLARIIHMVEEAQSRRAPSEQWVETFAKYYTPAMMLLALLVAVIPPFLFHQLWTPWFYQALVLLVIACPCALVISTPVSVVAGLSSAARAGVLVKGGVHLESPARLRAIAMDKTGTLTRGQPEVQTILPLNGHTVEELLERAAALEAHSEHPLAKAVLRKAEEQHISFLPAEQFQAIKGKGAQGLVDGRLFWIGSHRFLHEQNAESPEVHQDAERLEDAGHSVVAIGNDNHVCGLLSIADALRPEAVDAVAALKKLGIEKIVMLTGDNEGTARAIGAAAGVDDVRFELLPEDKSGAISALVDEYKNVAMVGDGINDAPALATATLGVAMGAMGSDAALETADVALMSDDLHKLVWLIQHSRRTLQIIKQNIIFALGLKAVFILLSLFGLATLWMAIAADMGASFLVIANGLRLLRGSSATISTPSSR
ncbi:MAG: heavy metal translocating P-type ATPase [Candidatus Hydrogenedentes bacterium]|nr:heavy metal translocating P-type ATPase [Candidatus Hydrogenedentota bacterium]